MIIAAMIGYYLFVIAVIASVGYLAGRKNIREFTASADRTIAELRQMSASDAERDAAFNREHETWRRTRADELEEPTAIRRER